MPLSNRAAIGAASSQHVSRTGRARVRRSRKRASVAGRLHKACRARSICVEKSNLAAHGSQGSERTPRAASRDSEHASTCLHLGAHQAGRGERARQCARRASLARARPHEGRPPLVRPSHGDADDSAARFCAHECALCASCPSHASGPRPTRANECGEQWREVKGTRKRVKTHPWRESIFLVEFCESRQNSASSVLAALVAFGKCWFRPVQCDESTLCVGSSEDHLVCCLATPGREFSRQIFQRLPVTPRVPLPPLTHVARHSPPRACQ